MKDPLRWICKCCRRRKKDNYNRSWEGRKGGYAYYKANDRICKKCVGVIAALERVEL